MSDVWRHIRNVDVWAFVGAVALATVTFPVRTVRWRYILRLEGATLPFVPLWHATAIGFMANNLLPARAGELARGYAARRLTAVRFSTALGSIAVERVLDGIGIIALLTLGLWAGGFATDPHVAGVSLARVVRSGAVLFGALLVAAVALVHWPDPAVRLARTISRRVLPERWAGLAMDGLSGVLSGLDALSSVGRLTRALAWTVVVWLLNAASFGLCFVAFGLEVPASAALVVQGLIAFGVALPSSPGFFGAFEAACRVSLALYAVPATQAVSYAVGYHFATFIPISVLGLWSLSRAHLHLADLRKSKGDRRDGQDRRDGRDR